MFVFAILFIALFTLALLIYENHKNEISLGPSTCSLGQTQQCNTGLLGACVPVAGGCAPNASGGLNAVYI